jgi:hypothetical protein
MTLATPNYLKIKRIKLLATSINLVLNLLQDLSMALISTTLLLGNSLIAWSKSLKQRVSFTKVTVI